MAWKYKEVQYTADLLAAITADVVAFPLLVSLTEDSDIQAECGSATWNTCIKFTSTDGTADLSFGLYPNSYHNPPAGNVLARVKVTLYNSASVGDVICRLYYSGTDTATEDKAGTVDNDYVLFMPMEEDPSGSAPQMLNWVSETNTGTSSGSMTSGDLIAGQVGGCIDFDGSDDYISVSVSSIGSTPMTYEAVSSIASDGSYPMIITNSAAVPDLRYLSNTRQPQFYSQSAAAVGLNEQHHICGTDSGSACELFVDGATQGVVGSPGYTTLTSFLIGKRNDGYHLQGTIDEVKISTVVRSVSWISISSFNDLTPFSSYTFGSEQTEGGGGGADVSADVPSGTLSFVGIAPVSSRTSAVAVGAIALSGVAATVARQAAIPPGPITLAGVPATSQISTPVPAGAATFAGVAPTAARTASVPAGAVSLTGVAATVDRTSPVPAGVITFVGNGLSSDGSASVPAGAIALAGVAPLAERTANVPSGSLVIDAGPRNEIVEVHQNDATGGNITISCGGYFSLVTASIKASAATWQAAIGTAAQVTKPTSTRIRFEFGAGVSSANANTEIPPVVININSTDGTPTVELIQNGRGYPVTADLQANVSAGTLTFTGTSQAASIEARVPPGSISFQATTVTTATTVEVPAGSISFLTLATELSNAVLVPAGMIAFAGPGVTVAGEFNQTAVIEGCVRIYTTLRGSVEVNPTLDGRTRLTPTIAGNVEVNP